VFSWISLAETATCRPQEGHMGDETLDFLGLWFITVPT
jgi:hypothetical protein